MKRITRSMALVFGLAMAVSLAPAGRAQEQGQLGPVYSTAPDADNPTRIRLGGDVAKANLVSSPQPVYPPLAAQTQTEGNVVLHAIIGTDGAVKQISVVSGHPLLIQSALDAVRQWKYKPTLLNGKAVEVDTTITVTFKLDESAAGQQTPSSGNPPTSSSASDASAAIDPQTKADILQLFGVMKLKEREADAAKAMAGPLRLMILPVLPDTPSRDKIADEFVTRLVAAVQSDEAVDALAVIYAKYLSDDDVKGLTGFYETPAGQHYSAVLAQLMTDSERVGEQIGKERAPGILTELCDEFPELQGQATFCAKREPVQPSQGMLSGAGSTPTSGGRR